MARDGPEVKLAEILRLKPEDEKALNSHALTRFNDWKARILSEVPQLRQISIEQIEADLDIYLDGNERVELNECLADITRWLYRCMGRGDGYCSYAYATWVIDPMFRVESLIMRVYQRAEAEQQKKEYSDRWRAAFVAIKPPVDEGKKYLSDEENDQFILAVGKAIDAYLERGLAYMADVRTSDYGWWLKKIQERKKEETQKLEATRAANEYNRHLNQEIEKLTSRLDHRRRDLARYFRGQIRDRRNTDRNFDYVLSKEDEVNFDRTLVSVANKKLEQLFSNELHDFIRLPPQYYRLYFPLPTASYSFKEVPCIDLSFEVFAAAYAEIWFKPGKKGFLGYDFPLPWIEEKNDLVLLEKPKFLGYHYLVFTSQDLGYNFWQSIPLVLLKGLLNGDAKPDGTIISAASDNVTTYRVRGFEKEIDVPDKLAEYLKIIGSIDGMVETGVITKKVGNIMKTVLGELKVKHEATPNGGRAAKRDSRKERAFRLFDAGRRPGDPEVKALGIKPNSAYRYYQDWKRSCNGN